MRGANSVRKLIRVKIADDNDLNQAKDSLLLKARFFRRVMKEAKESEAEPYKLLQLRREGRQIGRTPTKARTANRHRHYRSHATSSSSTYRSPGHSDEEGGKQVASSRTGNSSNSVSALQGRLRERERQRREQQRLLQEQVEKENETKVADAAGI